MAVAESNPPTSERLAKVMARAGLCSRRVAETWIVAGRVTVNGATVTSPATTVGPKDLVAVDGTPISDRAPTRLWLYHKPAGMLVTERDPEGRRTVFDDFARLGLPRVMTVGRLDYNTEGLLLLTNDGGLKRVLELPSTGWLRRYRVRAFGKVQDTDLAALKQGITVDKVHYGPIEAAVERRQGGNAWLSVALREGKNREIKNVLGAVGLEVNRLIRTSFGPFQLGDLKPGAAQAVRQQVLRDQLGVKLARQAGVAFQSQPAERQSTSLRPRRGPRGKRS